MEKYVIVSALLIGSNAVMVLVNYLIIHCAITSPKPWRWVWRYHNNKSATLMRPRQSDALLALVQWLIAAPLVHALCVSAPFADDDEPFHRFVVILWIQVLAVSLFLLFMSAAFSARRTAYLHSAHTVHFASAFAFLYHACLLGEPDGGVIAAVLLLLIVGVQIVMPPRALADRWAYTKPVAAAHVRGVNTDRIEERIWKRSSSAGSFASVAASVGDNDLSGNDDVEGRAIDEEIEALTSVSESGTPRAATAAAKKQPPRPISSLPVLPARLASGQPLILSTVASPRAPNPIARRFSTAEEQELRNGIERELAETGAQ